MLMKPAAITLVIGTGFYLLIEFLRLFNDSTLDNFWATYNGSLIEPLEIMSLLFAGVGLYLLFFSPTIHLHCWRWARFALLVPFLFILILLPTYQNGGGFISFGGTTELVILWGVVFAAVSILQTVYLRFWKKLGR